MYFKEEDIPFVLTVNQVAEILQWGETNTYKLFNEESFPVIHLGKQKRVLKSDFLKWLKEGAAS